MAGPDNDLLALALDALEVSDEREIGAGGQKTVRLVQRKGKHLVLKVISFGTSTAESLRRAEREVELLTSLESPHVVRVESALVELGEPVWGAAWLEEYLDGVDLTANLFSSQWSWQDAATMGLHVARGLGVAHSAGVIHRDLSSNNIRCLTDGTYKVMDFGFARYTLRSGITVAGQPGTPGFLSPEHLNSYSGGPTAASDVFAVGILMYAALVGRLPVQYLGDDSDYLRRLMTVQMDDIGDVRPDLGGPAQDLLRRCLHRQPARRFRNGTRLATALEALQ